MFSLCGELALGRLYAVVGMDWSSPGVTSCLRGFVLERTLRKDASFEAVWIHVTDGLIHLLASVGRKS